MIITRKVTAQNSEHDHVLASLPHPSWLVSGHLSDHHWTIAGGLGDRRRFDRAIVRFDRFVAPNVRLSDLPDTDCLSVKLLVYSEIEAGRYQPGRSAAVFAASCVNFVWWRLSKGIPCNSDLTPEWIRLFATEAAAGHIFLEDLVHRNTCEFIDNARANKVPLPIHLGEPNRKFSMVQMLEHLGIPYAANIGIAAKVLIRELAVEQGLKVSEWTPPAASEKAISSHRLSSIFAPVQALWTHRARLGKLALPFDPLEGEVNRKSWASKYSKKPSGRTLTISPFQMCYLVDAAFKWVLDYGPDVIRYVSEVSAELERTGNLKKPQSVSEALIQVNSTFSPNTTVDAVGSPWPIAPFNFDSRWSREEARPSLRKVVFGHLMAACAVVISTFTARRSEELLSLADGCVIDGDAGKELDTWIGKSNNYVVERIPIPEVVGKAVEILEWVSESRRERTGTGWLFAYDNMFMGTRGKPVSGRDGFGILQALSSFADFVEVPAMPDGGRWEPKVHQFRRFFGVTYFHRFHYPELAALSRFYRHDDPDTTRAYITERQPGAFLRTKEDQRIETQREAKIIERRAATFRDFDDEAKAFRVERFTAVALGEERMSGWCGDRLTREITSLVNGFRAQIDLAPADEIEPSQLNELIASFAEDKRLEPNPLGHSYCGCTQTITDLKAAKCLEASDTKPGEFLTAPDPAYAADEVCCNCPHNVQFQECQVYWEDVLRHEQKQSSCALGEISKAASERRVEIASDHIKRCFGGASE